MVVDSSINLIFVVDIITNFRTSFMHQRTGDEVMDLREIAKQYIKIQFWVDLLACIPFDLVGQYFFSSEDGSLLQLFSLLKLIRVLRLSRIIAIMKVKDDIKLSLRLIKLIFFLILYLH